MKYEIITDKENELILVANDRVILISTSISEIITELRKDYDQYRGLNKNLVQKDEKPVSFGQLFSL